jgi:hypothetical protein
MRRGKTFHSLRVDTVSIVNCAQVVVYNQVVLFALQKRGAGFAVHADLQNAAR